MREEGTRFWSVIFVVAVLAVIAVRVQVEANRDARWSTAAALGL